ncbi:penicillin-binding protein, beta-lactamase class C [Burkholderiales bacterium JOSHI_001]|nr:penicillin-binding protein, beta-lactamase class C [Burkholderiales bacterium JOSHI_001]
MLLLRSIALSAACLLTACASVPPPAQPVARGDFAAVKQQLQAFIAQQMNAERVAGLSIALVDDQQAIAAWGQGWADVRTKRPADGQTLYRMGSISKLFTDTAAMQLVAQRRLALDAPIQQVLPWFHLGDEQADAPITLRQLMTHHSGLPRDSDGGMWVDPAVAPATDFRTMLRGLADEPRAAPPGLAMAYSNIGLDLVGAALEAASGRAFEDQLQAAVLKPLGMHSAYVGTGVSDDPKMATGHLRGVAQQEPALRDVPAGGLSASVDEMAKFVAMQLAGGHNGMGEVVLPRREWAEMLRPQNTDVPLDADLRVGLGWMFSTFGMDTVKGGGPVAHHAGATFYFRSQLMMLPEQRLGVVVAANDGAALGVVNRVAQRALALMLEAKTGIPQPVPEPGFRPALQAWPDAQRAAVHRACLGDYATVAGPVTIKAQGPDLKAVMGAAEQTLELREGEGGRLGLRYRVLGLWSANLGPLGDLGLLCERVAGRDVLIGVMDGQRMLVGERLPARGPLPTAAAAWVGRYRQQRLPGEVPTARDVQVSVADGRLWVGYTIHPAFGGQRVRTLLRPESDTRARLVGPLADTGPVVTLQPQPGQPPLIRFSGAVFERESP